MNTCKVGPIKSPTAVTQARADPSTKSVGRDKSQTSDLSSLKSGRTTNYKIFKLLNSIVFIFTFRTGHVRIESLHWESFEFNQQFLYHRIAEQFY